MRFTAKYDIIESRKGLKNQGLVSVLLSRNQSENRRQVNIVCIEDLVPENHILRDIDKAIDFSFIYDEVKELYCEDNGRPSIDPVVLFKIVMIQYTFGIRSMRQTIKEIEVNMAYRWFLGYDMLEKVPHFTTFGRIICVVLQAAIYSKGFSSGF